MSARRVDIRDHVCWNTIRRVASASMWRRLRWVNTRHTMHSICIDTAYDRCKDNDKPNDDDNWKKKIVEGIFFVII